MASSKVRALSTRKARVLVLAHKRSRICIFTVSSSSSRDKATFYNPQFTRGDRERSISLRRTPGALHDRRRKFLGFPDFESPENAATAIPRNHVHEASHKSTLMPSQSLQKSNQQSFDVNQSPAPRLSSTGDDLFNTSSGLPARFDSPNSTVQTLSRNQIHAAATGTEPSNHRTPMLGQSLQKPNEQSCNITRAPRILIGDDLFNTSSDLPAIAAQMSPSEAYPVETAISRIKGAQNRWLPFSGTDSCDNILLFEPRRIEEMSILPRPDWFCCELEPSETQASL